jgi:hypothetical protein
MFEVEIGKSFEENPLKAAKSAANDLLRKLMNEPQIALLFLSGYSEDKEILEEIKESLPNTTILGGKFTSQSFGKELFFKGISLVGIRLHKISFGIEGGEVEGDEEIFAQRVAQSLNEKIKNLKLLTLFVTSALQNIEGIVKGVQRVFGENCPIVGIVSGDEFLFEEPPIYLNEKIIKKGILILGFSGEIFFEVGTTFGFEPIGMPFEITASFQKTISKIEGDDPILFYQKYFGKNAYLLKEKLASPLSTNYPLAIQIDEENFILRNVIGYKGKSLLLLGQIPQKSKAYFTIGDEDKAKEDTKKTALEVFEKMAPKEARAVFLFGSALRQKFLGLEVLNEIQLVKNVFGESAQAVYLSGFGEIGPLAGFGKGSPGLFHNSSLIILAVG